MIRSFFVGFLLALSLKLGRVILDGGVVLWMRVKLKPHKAGVGSTLALGGFALRWGQSHDGAPAGRWMPRSAR